MREIGWNNFKHNEAKNGGGGEEKMG